ncbi:MAG: imidazole glycerol phosphate synthase subunit HisH [Lachnospiraceae bacterium]|nr:imidazole glycerol phosphate synthase subunit HisH [Lachnospiraceae bacterium]
MIAIIDYDAGNVKSVQHAFEKLGQRAEITSDPKTILRADRVVLPGVGNFGDAVGNLRKYEMDKVLEEVVARRMPFLGICVGMQALFEGSEESPEVPGLGIFKGQCRRFTEKAGLKIPQIGWNSIHVMNGGDLFRDIPNGAYVYFVHSYYVDSEDKTIVKAVSEYANIIDASVQKGSIFACQFHPEKSGDVGLKILQNFLNWKKEET